MEESEERKSLEELQEVQNGPSEQRGNCRLEQDSTTNRSKSRPDSSNFAWSIEDLTRIFKIEITHKLNVDPSFSLSKQKIINFLHKANQAINNDVDYLLKVGYIREVNHLQWYSIVVKKKSRKPTLCIEFTYQNKACPNDVFPFPKIDMLLDATTNHAMMSFFIAFSDYNQIKMNLSNEEKTSFITKWGTY